MHELEVQVPPFRETPNKRHWHWSHWLSLWEASGKATVAWTFESPHRHRWRSYHPGDHHLAELWWTSSWGECRNDTVECQMSHVYCRMPQILCQDATSRMSQNMPHRMPDKLWEHVSHRRSEFITSEHMSGKFSEYACAFKMYVRSNVSWWGSYEVE